MCEIHLSSFWRSPNFFAVSDYVAVYTRMQTGSENEEKIIFFTPLFTRINGGRQGSRESQRPFVDLAEKHLWGVKRLALLESSCKADGVAKCTRVTGTMCKKIIYQNLKLIKKSLEQGKYLFSFLKMGFGNSETDYNLSICMSSINEIRFPKS